MRKNFKRTWRSIPTVFLIGGLITSSLVINPWNVQHVTAATSTEKKQVLQETTDVISITNGDFENPQFSATYKVFDQASVPGWNTTASDGRIELQRNVQGITAISGKQYAELNADEVASLYQDIPTTPGLNVRWQVYHRGRKGTDTASVTFGAPGGAMVEQTRMTDGNSQWGLHTGVYTIPEGQTVTRFQFDSISSAGGDGVGNLLDNIQFATQSILDVEGSFSTADMKVRNTTNYQLQVANVGGMTAVNNTFTVKIPPELSYSPGTLSSSDTSITNEQYNATTGELTFAISGLKKDASAMIQIPLKGIEITDTAAPITSVTYNDENFDTDVYNANAADSSITILDNHIPVITGELETMIQPDASFDPMSTIQATDVEDGDITTNVNVAGSVDTSKSGTYELTYDVTDSDGNTASFRRIVTVAEKPVIRATTKVAIQKGDSFDPLAGVKATDKEDGDLTSQLMIDGSVDTSQLGDYELTYTVTDSDGNTTTLIRTITVQDNPVFEFNEAPEDLVFETTEITSGEVDIPRQNPDWKLQIKDTRNNGEKWQVTGTVNGPFVDVNNPSNKKLYDALIYTKDGVETRIMDNQAFVIGEGTSNSDDITTIQYAADEGIHMKINPTGVKADSHYQTSITWTLSDAP
ncbi:DUF5011 domain-containing protein [Listeria sp. FSL L7-1582]|uniref:immunoglobulin-like domain-containing protein n=1 Tax=Listeria portnoyi TaxID=2713504 RepID=UPI00164ECA76|nr:immunoglobulin-like domain-containing protein [Listeria portnoyi]MBC6309942.1 DUF5011 domain-containing protein [Listeria portnoyi]